jgi:Xaa-Pro aminopeptidase
MLIHPEKRAIAGLDEAEILAAKRPGMGLTDCEPLSFDPRELRRKRLERLRHMLAEREYAGCVLLDPNNQRYATGSRNMFGYFLRNSTRYLFVSTDGPVVLFEYPQSAHVSEVLETIDEARKSRIVWSSVLGKDLETTRPFAEEIADLVRAHGGGNRRVGLDRCFLGLALALEAEGCEPVDCMQDVLRVRSVKVPEEIACLTLSMAGTEAAVFDVTEAIRPGVTENELFAEFYGSVIRHGGEMVETRLLSSGTRTNPWFNEASARTVRPGELVALDTDTIGAFGYYSDFSRTFHCGPGKPSGEQQTLYQMAYDQLHHNIEIIEPGLTYRQVAERAWDIPERYVERRYTSVMHGCGMHGEAPFITHASDFSEFGGEGRLEPGMVLCVESYIGEVGGREGVKLEDEVVVTERGCERISRFPFDEHLLGR